MIIIEARHDEGGGISPARPIPSTALRVHSNGQSYWVAETAEDVAAIEAMMPAQESQPE